MTYIYSEYVGRIIIVSEHFLTLYLDFLLLTFPLTGTVFFTVFIESFYHQNIPRSDLENSLDLSRGVPDRPSKKTFSFGHCVVLVPGRFAPITCSTRSPRVVSPHLIAII
jgi:hypothetical protein